MKIQYGFKKCIYCLENEADSWEHIIPECIGGTLEAKMLCSECNNKYLGSRLISDIKKDLSIRLAIRNLKNEIPELFEAMEKNQKYVSKDINKNIVKLKYKDSKFEVIAHEKEDGSLILDTKKGVKNIKQILKKEGLSEDEIKKAIQLFKRLGENEPIQLSKSSKVVKWSLETPFPELKGPLLDERFVVLMAYEYLALAIGNLISHSKLNFIREFVKDGKKSQNLKVEPWATREYKPYHSIHPEFSETEVIINIILFGWLVYKVFFYLGPAKLPCPDLVYLEDLKNKKILFAKSVDGAKKDEFYCLN